MNAQKEVDAMLEKYDILSYRSLFAQPQYSKQNMPRDIDRLIKPFVLSDEEKKMKPVDMSNFQLDSLTSVKPEQFIVADSVAVATKAAARKSAGSKSGDRKRRQTSAVAQDKDLDNEVELDDTLSAARKKFRSERRGKRNESIGVGVSSYSLPPEILQPILQELFDEFWNLELESQLAIPFFATITRENCNALGLPGFFEKVMQECTLSNINDKLSRGHYTSPEAFEADFNTMFANVMTYFDESSPQYIQAQVMMDMFAGRWMEAKEKMKLG